MSTIPPFSGSGCIHCYPMSMNQEKDTRLQSILRSGQWTLEDLAWFMEEWSGKDRGWMIDILREGFEASVGESTPGEDRISKRILEGLHLTMEDASVGKKPAAKVSRISRIAAAASLVVGLLGLSYFWITDRGSSPDRIVGPGSSIVPDVAPGSDKALLILPGGRTIGLDSSGEGSLSVGRESLDVRLHEGGIRYAISEVGPDRASVSEMHTLVTPRGGQFRLTLSDGTGVWLNAASSIRYPAMFRVGERRVEISGEAYLEVAHDTGRPFIVDVDGRAVVRVTGTKFNVNAYRDEPSLDVTLLEGSVSVRRNADGSQAVLTPGLQASISADGTPTVRRVDDLESLMAWKEGRFQFGDGMEIESVMRQLSRWYDVDVRYQGTVEGRVGGGISRLVNLSQVLEMIGLTGIAKFSMDGRVVRVLAPGQIPGPSGSKH